MPRIVEESLQVRTEMQETDPFRQDLGIDNIEADSLLSWKRKGGRKGSHPGGKAFCRVVLPLPLPLTVQARI